MTTEDRLRAALRFILLPARRWVDDCPHPREEGDRHCVIDDGDSNLCDACCVDITAASLAAAAVGLAMSPSDRRAPQVRARALALVREAGLADDVQPFDPKQWSGATVAQVDLPEGVSPDEVLAFLHGRGARAVDPTGGAGQLAQAFTEAFLRRAPHAAAPGDTLAVAEVETLVPVDHAGHRVDMPMSEALRAEANGDLGSFACGCCKRTLPAALAAGDDDRPYGVDHLCTECARTCGCYSDVGDIYGLVENCFVAQAHAFAAELRERVGPEADVVVCDGWSVKALVDGVARMFRPDAAAVETLRRAVADEAQRPALLAALERWRVT